MLVNVLGWVAKRDIPIIVEGNAEASSDCLYGFCKHSLGSVVCDGWV